MLVEALDEVGPEAEPFAGLLTGRLLAHLTQRRRSVKITAQMQRVIGQGILKSAFHQGITAKGDTIV